MVTDRTFLCGVYKAAQAHSQIAPTYSYIFDYNGQYNAITNYGYSTSEWGESPKLINMIEIDLHNVLILKCNVCFLDCC